MTMDIQLELERRFARLMKLSIVNVDFFNDLHDYVAIFETTPEIKSFLEVEQEKREKIREDLANNKKLSKKEVNEIFNLTVAQNIWHDYILLSDTYQDIEKIRAYPNVSHEEIEMAEAYSSFDPYKKGWLYKEALEKVHHKIISFLNSTKTEMSPATGKLKFDEEKGIILIGLKKCKLPFKKFEYYLFKTLYKHPLGERVPESDILTAFGYECKADSETAAYDALRRLNERAKKSFGIDKLIDYEGSNFWINWP